MDAFGRRLLCGRLTKASLAAIATEAGVPVSISLGAVKKPEAARHVAKAMAATGWLPEALRLPSGEVSIAA